MQFFCAIYPKCPNLLYNILIADVHVKYSPFSDLVVLENSWVLWYLNCWYPAFPSSWIPLSVPQSLPKSCTRKGPTPSAEKEQNLSSKKRRILHDRRLAEFICQIKTEVQIWRRPAIVTCLYKADRRGNNSWHWEPKSTWIISLQYFSFFSTQNAKNVIFQTNKIQKLKHVGKSCLNPGTYCSLFFCAD